MNCPLIDGLPPARLLLQVVSFVVRYGLVAAEAEDYVVAIVESFGWRLRSGGMLGVLLFELGLVCVLTHIRLVAGNGEVAPSIADGLNNSC